jgi:hypothetical protein
MKKKFCSLFIILFSALFFVLASGVVITLHECCHNLHYDKNEHNHCYETVIFIKIEDVFIKSKTTQFFFPFSIVETILHDTISINQFYKLITPHFQHSVPPLLKFVGVNFVNFTSQRILYS